MCRQVISRHIIKKSHRLLASFQFCEMIEVRYMFHVSLIHCCRVTHICVSKLTIIGSDNGLSPGRRQATIRTNAAILLTGPLITNSSESFVEIITFSFKKCNWKCRLENGGHFVSVCLGLSELKIFCTASINSLWPSDAIWRQRSGSALAHVMDCCLTAPSHYLNQCWLIISKV